MHLTPAVSVVAGAASVSTAANKNAGTLSLRGGGGSPSSTTSASASSSSSSESGAGGSGSGSSPPSLAAIFSNCGQISRPGSHHSCSNHRHAKPPQSHVTRLALPRSVHPPGHCATGWTRAGADRVEDDHSDRERVVGRGCKSAHSGRVSRFAAEATSAEGAQQNASSGSWPAGGRVSPPSPPHTRIHARSSCAPWLRAHPSARSGIAARSGPAPAPAVGNERH